MAADIVLTDITNGNLNIGNDWEGTGVFDVLIGAVNKNIESQYNKGRITGSDYANVYLGSIQAVLQQSMEYVLREKVTEAQVAGLEKDLELKSYDLINVKPKELALMDKELLVKQQELELRKTEANRLKDTTEAELEKQWGYAVTRSVDGELVLGATTGLGAIDKELELKTKTIALQEYELVELKPAELAIREKEIELKTTEADRMKNVTEAELEKQWGYDVTRVAGELVLGAATGLGAIDKNIALQEYELTQLKPKELALREKELELRTTEVTRVKGTTEAELEKQWGYNVTRDVNDELVLGATTGTGAIDKELELKTKQISVMEKDIVLKDAQKALVYTETIGKDKEVAMMGMDNVMKLREASKAGNTNYVYVPAYKETV